VELSSLIDVYEVARAFASLFVIMNPFASIPIFLKVAGEGKARAATQAVLVAGGVLFTFLFFGPVLLEVFHITLDSLRVAGGLVLGILGVRLVLGLRVLDREGEGGHGPALTLIGTPMLTGPGVITMTMILVKESGAFVTACAAVGSLALSWLLLAISGLLSRVMGRNAIEITSRVMGLLVTATAVEMVVRGIREMLRAL
jgi:multiple antibiotic resistance protein